MLMKTTCIKSLFAVVSMLALICVSCDKDSPEVAQPGNNADDQSAVTGAFFPDTCVDKTVAAWYSAYTEEDYKKKVEAVFLFSDSTLAVTKSKVYSEEDGRDSSRVVMYAGTWQIVQGDYDNGILAFHITPGSTIQVNIVDGKLSFMDQTYARRDNYKVPDASKSTENEFIGTVQPYLPSLNLEIEYAAWYTSTVQETNRIKIDAILLSTDSLLVYTRSKFYTQKDGRKPSNELLYIGTYKITEGDYTNGKAFIQLTKLQSYDAVITDGRMEVMDMVFTKQDNAAL